MAVLRQATPRDAPAIASLILSESGREVDGQRLRQALERFTCCVAEDGDGLLGVGLSASFAPDMLELRELLVRGDHRGEGIGAGLARLVEASVPATTRAMVLVNSDLYPGAADKRPAYGFFLSQGYQLVYDTGNSRVLIKALAGSAAPAIPTATESRTSSSAS